MVTATTSTSTTALQVLTDLGWHYTKTSSNPRRAYQGPCPVGRHENDHVSPAFSLAQDGQAFLCFKCDFSGYGPAQLLQKMGQEPIRPMPLPAASKPSKKQRVEFQGATIESLAKAKGLNPDYLRHLGWQDTKHRGVQAVAMPYLDQQGNPTITKYRVGIDEGVKTLWPKGTKIMPMGLQELPYARERGFIIGVEGESDWATLDYTGFPALGLPGANTWKTEWLAYTNGIEKVYVWEESGGKPNTQGLTPGQQMVKRVADSQGKVWVIKAPPGAKDPTELAQLCGPERFPDRMQELIDGAEEIAGEGYREKLPTGPHKHQEASSELHRAPWKILNSCGHIHHRMEKWAQQHGKSLNLTTLVYKHQSHLLELYPNDAEFCLLPKGAQLDIEPDMQDCDSCVLLENPVLFISHEELLGLIYSTVGVLTLSGQEVPASKRISECGKDASMSCPQDGPQYYFKHACRSAFCPLCNSKMSAKLARMCLPDLEEGQGSYTEVWIESRYQLPEDRLHWEGQFNTLMDTWERTIAKASRRKALKKRVLFRSHASYYTNEECITHWKVMVKEEEQGQAREALEDLAEALGGAIACERRYTNGAQAVMQLVADTMTNFIGMAGGMSFQDKRDLFAAHYFATKGRHICQGLGEVYKLLGELPRLDPPKCTICGQQLSEVITDPNPEHLPSGTPSGIVPHRR